MKRFTSALLAALACGVLSAPADAQDTIYRKGGGTIGKSGEVEIEDITISEIKYRLKGVGRIQTAKRDQVSGWEFGEAPRAYDNALQALQDGLFANAAAGFTRMSSRDHRQKWVKPFSMFYRAEALRKGGAIPQSIDGYKNYLKAYPTHAMVPDAWMGLGQAFLARNKKRDARKAFDKVAGGAFGESFAIQGAIWNARVLEIESKWAEAKAAYAKLESRAGSKYPDVAREAKLRKNLTAVQISKKRKDDSGLKKARSALQRIINRKDVPLAIEAAAWNGVGETYYYLARPEWIEALVAFSHVWVRFADHHAEVPKALYHASHAYFNAADKIGSDADWSKRKARQLTGKLKNLYRGNFWAKKPGPK